jgi:hypothetical protein
MPSKNAVAPEPAIEAGSKDTEKPVETTSLRQLFRYATYQAVVPICNIS